MGLNEVGYGTVVPSSVSVNRPASTTRQMDASQASSSASICGSMGRLGRLARKLFVLFDQPCQKSG